jgi:ADP-heptose:LPS heptosyltransferase
VVLLGQRNLFVDGEQTIKSNPIKIFEDVIDLRDASPLLESLKIINYAKFIVGVDNGLFHLAGLTQTPIVAGYTTVAPELRMPYRNNKLGWNVGPCVPQSEWRFCQSATTIP